MVSVHPRWSATIFLFRQLGLLQVALSNSDSLADRLRVLQSTLVDFQESTAKRDEAFHKEIDAVIARFEVTLSPSPLPCPDQFSVLRRRPKPRTSKLFPVALQPR